MAREPAWEGLPVSEPLDAAARFQVHGPRRAHGLDTFHAAASRIVAHSMSGARDARPATTSCGETGGASMRDDSASTLGDYLAVLRRRAWMVLGAALLTVMTAFLYASHQPKRFAASAQVLLNQTGGVSTSGQPVNAPDAARYDETQARVAVTPVLARRVLVAA